MTEHEISVLRRLHHPSVVSLLYRFRLSERAEVGATRETARVRRATRDRRRRPCRSASASCSSSCRPTLSKLRLTLPGRRFDALDARLYAWQASAAVDYVHARGVTHCDVSGGGGGGSHFEAAPPPPPPLAAEALKSDRRRALRRAQAGRLWQREGAAQGQPPQPLSSETVSGCSLASH